jgi:nitroimidazol reductase NimA-like FMN-containing flavoprotein (pyridoxamine 5'-phosphate oxidase superfamily)
MSEATSRTRVRRIPDRGHYDAATIHSVLDAAMLCHVGFTVDEQPYVIPTLFARDGEHVVFHGSAASRMLRHAATSVPVCLEVEIVDAIVLARSAFNHSMNYRSVLVLGAAEIVSDEAEKLRALELISEHVLPGRWADVRPPSAKELKATSVLRLSLKEASAKIRTGPPLDEDEDYALPIWAGVLPVVATRGQAVPDPRMTREFPGIPLPDYLKPR